MLISLIFSRFFDFDFNFIIQYCSFIFALSYYTVLLFVIWAVVSAVAAFLTLGTHVLLFCSAFSDIVLCFQNKLMMMMMMTYGLFCADVPLKNYSLTVTLSRTCHMHCHKLNSITVTQTNLSQTCSRFMVRIIDYHGPWTVSVKVGIMEFRL